MSLTTWVAGTAWTVTSVPELLPVRMGWLASVGVVFAVLLGQRAPPSVTRPRGPSPRVYVGAAGCLGVLVTPPGWLGLIAVLLVGALGGRALWRRRVERIAAESTARHLVEVCDLIASELAAGRTGEAALGEAAGAWPAFGPVADACRLGGDVPAALRELAGTPGADGLLLLAGAWAVSHRTGAGLAASTRRVADTVRRDQALRRVVRGELASARSTARLVAALPVAALLMGSGAGADPWSFLVMSPPGLAFLAAGLAIGFAGLWWIELIAREVDR